MRRFGPSFLSAALLIAVAMVPARAEPVDLQPLIAPTELSALQDNSGIVVLDIRGEGYEEGHVPGAVHAPYGRWRGPAGNPGELIGEDALTSLLRELGLEPGDAVVVTYQGKDATDFGAAARVYWTLKSAGFEELSILNGGINAWTDAGLTLATEAVRPEPSMITASYSDRWLATREMVRAVVEGERQATLVDARPEDFFEGETQHPAAARPGTLPQARMFTHSGWFENDAPTIIQPDTARRLAEEAGYTANSGTLVSFCNTGHWAATNWFALSELAGIEDVKLYPESMVGWSQAGLPMDNTPGRLKNLWNKVKGVL